MPKSKDKPEIRKEIREKCVLMVMLNAGGCTEEEIITKMFSDDEICIHLFEDIKNEREFLINEAKREGKKFQEHAYNRIKGTVSKMLKEWRKPEFKLIKIDRNESPYQFHLNDEMATYIYYVITNGLNIYPYFAKWLSEEYYFCTNRLGFKIQDYLYRGTRAEIANVYFARSIFFKQVLLPKFTRFIDARATAENDLYKPSLPDRIFSLIYHSPSAMRSFMMDYAPISTFPRDPHPNPAFSAFDIALFDQAVPENPQMKLGQIMGIYHSCMQGFKEDLESQRIGGTYLDSNTNEPITPCWMQVKGGKFDLVCYVPNGTKDVRSKENELLIATMKEVYAPNNMDRKDSCILVFRWME